MHTYLRHPSDMPVELRLRRLPPISRQQLCNISLGGLACNSSRRFRRGSAVELRIPALGEQARYRGVVAWCRRQADAFLVGIAFLDEDTLFRARMVEQICQIEHYRREQEQLRGQPLDSESMAHEWITRHAAEFARASFI